MLETIGTPLRQLVEQLKPAVHDVGWALVLVALGLRLCVLPFTLKQRRTALMFARLRPELEAIRRQHAGNREASIQAQLEFVRQQNYDPKPGCIATIIEVVFLLLVLSATSRWPALNQQTAFSGEWIPDVMQPDRAANFGRTLVLVGRHLHVLPLVWLVAASLRLLLPQPAGTGRERVLSQIGPPLVVSVFAYHASAAIWLLILPWVLVSEIERACVREVAPQPVADAAGTSTTAANIPPAAASSAGAGADSDPGRGPDA